jgi:hypothetical protein
MSRQVDTATAAELERLERLLLDPAVRRDPQQVSALLTEDFFEFGASGRIWTREAALELLAKENYSPPAVADFACHVLAEGVVLATYRAVRVGADRVRQVTLRSSIWIRESGSWRMRFHQGTRAIRAAEESVTARGA